MDNIEFLRNQGERRITINEFIEAYYGSKILPFQTEFIDFIEDIVKETIKMNRVMVYEGRINEYGNHLEKVLVCAINEKYTDIKAENLGSGYPDTRFEYNGVTFYPEIKINPNVYETDAFRTFYTSTPKEKTKKMKSIKDGCHLLFHFEHNGPGILTGRYRVSDLDGYEYTALGAIQQGNTKDLYEIHNKVIIQG